MPSAVVLLSGGLDSAVTLAIAKSRGFECRCLSFDYGQRHCAELHAAADVARSLGAAEHLTVPLDLRAFGGSALTASDIDVPKHRSDAEIASGTIPVTYVPARNLVFLSIATGFAEVRGAADVFLGVNAVDYSGYPDCRPEFVRAFERAANLATRAGVQAAARGEVALRVHAPLMDLAKARIIRLGHELGVDFVLTRSCYDPDGAGRACGECDACLLRAKGFSEAGVADPTVYAPGVRP